MFQRVLKKYGARSRRESDPDHRWTIENPYGNQWFCGRGTGPHQIFAGAHCEFTWLLGNLRNHWEINHSSLCLLHLTPIFPKRGSQVPRNLQLGTLDF